MVKHVVERIESNGPLQVFFEREPVLYLVLDRQKLSATADGDGEPLVGVGALSVELQSPFGILDG
jgi:hypothetical protein